MIFGFYFRVSIASEFAFNGNMGGCNGVTGMICLRQSFVELLKKNEKLAGTEVIINALEQKTQAPREHHMAIRPLKKGYQNSIGAHGEALVIATLSRSVFGQYRRPLFRATPLGEKFPIVDLIVDALDPHEHSMGHFFIQVKSTQMANPKSKRMKIEIELTKFNALASIPIPTFLAGVDAVSDKVYLVAANLPARKGFSSITKSFDLDDESTRVMLYKEVTDFWCRWKKAVRKTETEFKR